MKIVPLNFCADSFGLNAASAKFLSFTCRTLFSFSPLKQGFALNFQVVRGKCVDVSLISSENTIIIEFDLN
jgi:hypothetical protein